jgi:hypothetical protein
MLVAELGKLISPLTAVGPKNSAWLNMLNASSRNCNDFVSPSLTHFASETSKFSIPGP